MTPLAVRLRTRVGNVEQLAPLRIRDFRLMWVGALLSFTGTWVQTVAQGWLVYDLTRDPRTLMWVTVLNMLPVSLLGPVAGTLTDTLNKRTVLIMCQIVFAFNALLLASALHFEFLRIEMIFAVALLNGLASTLETPTRQSIVTSVVPPDAVSAAVPLQAMTFNLSRIAGPAIGGILLDRFGPQACYIVNGLSYIGLIFGALAVRASLRSVLRGPEPILDLVREGFLYTFRKPALKMLFLMEAALSVFGLAYIPLLPAFAREVLGIPKGGLGTIYTAVGVGALAGLLLLLYLSQRPLKTLIVKWAMTSFGVALLCVSFVNVKWVALPLFTLLGMSAIMQFNTTNTLFQLNAPPALRGRVIAMHVWAISGLGPIALPLFGWIAEQHGTPSAMRLGALILVGCAFLMWIQRRHLEGLDST